MNEPAWTHEQPKTVLLATDLSTRCDRALDRSAQLAKRWNARLIVLHVLDQKGEALEVRWEDQPVWQRPPDRQAVALEQIRHDLLEDLTDVHVIIEQGDPAPKIEEVARAMGAGLVVTGVARNEMFGRLFVGNTVVRLTRHSAVPILVVKTRPRVYREILVATDFSESSRHALDAAVTFFPDASVTLLHAYEVPFSGLMNRSDLLKAMQSFEREAFDQFLVMHPLTPEQRRRIKTVVEHGAPELMIRRYMHDRGVDLVVLGSHGRSAVFETFIGSTARHLVESAPGDVLLIRDPRAVTP